MRLKNNRGLLKVACFSVLAFLTVFGVNIAFADVSPFKIIAAEVTEHSETAVGGITGFSADRISNNFVFHKVGDTVTYKICVKNVSDKARIIEDVDSSHKGDLFTYEFNHLSGATIEPGDTFDFVLKTTYVKGVGDVSKRDLNSETQIIFEYSDGSSSTIVIANPTTWDNISVFGIIAIVCVLGLLVVVILHSGMSTKKKVIVGGILLAIACLPLPFANAADGVYDATLASKYSFKDELVVHFLSADGTEEFTREIIGYEELAEQVVVPGEVEGYYFVGWLTEEDELFDFSTPIVDDLKLYAKYAPYVYTLRFDGNGATSGTMPAQKVSYDELTMINANKFVRAGYDFLGWKDDNGDDYANEQEIKNLCKTDCVINLHANWQARTDTPYFVVNELMTVDGDEYIAMPAVKYTGKTDDYASPVPVELANFVTPAQQSAQIKGDGSTTIHYKYDRVQYILTLNDAKFIETATPAGKYNFGKEITLKAKSRAGWKFTGWSNGATDEEVKFAMNGDVEIGPKYTESELITVFSHEKPCTFNGILSSNYRKSGALIDGLLKADNITGDECTEYADKTYIDTGVKVYSKANAHKDLLVEFTIDEYTPANNGYRATFMSFTREEGSISYPGSVFRRYDDTDSFLLGVNVVKDKVKTLNFKKNFSLSAVQSVKIMRKNDAICYSINGAKPVYVGDNTPFNQYFEEPTVTFGAAISHESDGTPMRMLNGTLSGMKIKMGVDSTDELDCKKR